MSKIKGFFNLEELEEMGVGKNLIEDACNKCGLYKNCISPKMPVSGKGKRKILIIAQNPGKTEDEESRQLVGEAGQLWRNKLIERNLDLDIDFWKDNSIRCFTPNNREPTKTELKACKSNLDKTIKDLKPEFIWLLGKSAVESFYMGKFSDISIGRWRNLCIPDKSTNAYILPMYHPSFLLRNQGNSIIESVFDRDLDFAINCLKLKPYQHKEYLDFVFPLTKYDDAINMLEIILEEKPTIAFDYETTGLKPYNKGHKIVAISICDSDDYAFSFPYQHKYHQWNDKEFKNITNLWIKILLNKDISKIGHNQKFEEMWSRIIFGIDKVENFNYCTMNTSHIIDNREHFTGLKFQTYINFGIEDYGKNIKPYLNSINSMGFNKVEEAPFNELLLYNAVDSLMTKWLYGKQKIILNKNPNLEKARKFFQEGLFCFADIEQNGINSDIDYYNNTYKILEQIIIDKEKELNKFKEIKEFERIYRRKINFDSSTDLRELLFNIMKIPSHKTTNKMMRSVDEEVLSKIDHPIPKKILEKRKINKTKNTYLAQFIREINDDGRIRPFFDLHIPRSLRSSSSYPNWQNLPEHNEEAKKLVKTGIIPSKGNKLLDWDYNAIEVRMGAIFTKDPVLINYICNPKTDMHRDIASEIFQLPKNKITKEIRFIAKNDFVFPEFYGSYYRNITKNIWDDSLHLKTKDGTTIEEHLKNVGIINREAYDDFENHVKDVEYKFWKKFSVFKQWQEDHIVNFIQKGYIEMFYGFQTGGYMTRNKIINYPIQGTAFHCLLWSIIEINKELKKNNFKTKIVGQIHDSCIYDLFPDEERDVIKLSEYIATKKIREEFPWINVPLTIEWESTNIDEPWYYSRPLK